MWLWKLNTRYFYKKEFLEKFIEYMNNIQFKDLNLSSSDFINAKFISYISSFNTEIDSFNSKIEKVSFEHKMIENEIKKKLSQLFTFYKI